MPYAIPSPEAIAGQYATLIQALCEIAEAYYYLGRLDDARRLLETSAPLIEQPEVLPKDQVTLLLQQGKILATTIFLADGDFDTTMAVLSRARQIAETTQNRQLIGGALNLIGQAYYFKELNGAGQDWDTPRAYFQQALEQQETAQDTAGASEALFHIGLMHERKTEYDTASEYYQRVLDLTAQHGHKRERSYAARHLAGIYHQRGDLVQALRYFKESLALREEIGLKLFLPFAHIAVGDVVYDQGDITGAFAQYQKAYELSEEMNLKAGLISSLLSMGYGHKEQQAFSDALGCFEQARALAQSIGFQRGIVAASAEIEAIARHNDDERTSGTDVDH